MKSLHIFLEGTWFYKWRIHGLASTVHCWSYQLGNSLVRGFNLLWTGQMDVFHRPKNGFLKKKMIDQGKTKPRTINPLIPIEVIEKLVHSYSSFPISLTMNDWPQTENMILPSKSIILHLSFWVVWVWLHYAESLWCHEFTNRWNGVGSQPEFVVAHMAKDLFING